MILFVGMVGFVPVMVQANEEPDYYTIPQIQGDGFVNTIPEDVDIVTTPTDDHRSYHVSSEKIKRELGFVPQHSIEEAVQDLLNAFKAGKIPDSMTDIRYYNIKTMQAIKKN